MNPNDLDPVDPKTGLVRVVRRAVQRFKRAEEH